MDRDITVLFMVMSATIIALNRQPVRFSRRQLIVRFAVSSRFRER